MLGVGCWVLDVGCWMLGVGCWVKLEQSFPVSNIFFNINKNGSHQVFAFLD